MADPTPATTRGVEKERVCETCEEWVYYDNGDCTFHCHCGAGWKWKIVERRAIGNAK